jgi:hypothetical protein
MELSYTTASMFRSCQKKFYWRYVLGLVPVSRSSSLTLGGILHLAFDAFYKGMDDKDVFHFIANRFTEEMGKEEVADQENILVNKYTALGMWINYPFKNLKEFDSIASEEEFEIDLIDDIKFIGKVDGRVFQSGNWWVRELKTTGLSSRQFIGRCEVSGQSTGYVYGLRKKGYDVKGILYEYIKKPLLRKGLKENADDFGRRIMKDYKERPKFYFNRHMSYRNPVDMDNFLEDMQSLAKEIIYHIDKSSFYRNVDSCWNYNTECEYSKICFSKEPDPLTLELYYKRKEEKNGRKTGTGTDIART